MIAPSERIEVTADRIACDGGGGALGHPRVFLTLGENGWVECPYCDRLYVKPGVQPPTQTTAQQGA